MSSRTVGWIQLATLLLLIAFWCSSPDYEILLQVTVCTAACAAAFHSGEQHRYILATVFAGMALLFNPVVPIMLSSGAFLWAIWYHCAHCVIVSEGAKRGVRRHV